MQNVNKTTKQGKYMLQQKIISFSFLLSIRKLKEAQMFRKEENLFTVMLFSRQKLIMTKQILKYCFGCL